jgi:hypothetical protein
LKDNSKLERCSVDKNFTPVATIDDLVLKAEQGILPTRNPVGEPMEIKIKIHPPKSPPLELGFFEVSGEDLVGIIPNARKAPILPEKFKEALANQHINYLFVLVSDAEMARERPDEFNEDRLFASFLDYVTQEYKHLERTPILLVVSKWYGANATTFKDPELYVSTKLPGTYSRLIHLKHKKINHAIVGHYIGTKLDSTDNDGKNVGYIAERNMTSTGLIAQWIYKNFKKCNFEHKNFFSKILDFIHNPS